METGLARKPGTWAPGISGNPNGRPLNARGQFSQAFLHDLAEVWREHGKATMLHTATLQPEAFFSVCARLLGPEVKLSIEQQYPGALTPDDLAILRAIKEAIPDAGEREPGEVLAYVRDTLAAASAKTIDCTE